MTDFTKPGEAEVEKERLKAMNGAIEEVRKLAKAGTGPELDKEVKELVVGDRVIHGEGNFQIKRTGYSSYEVKLGDDEEDA